jgi:leucyl aminopeptidase (aminopeptidase T)
VGMSDEVLVERLVPTGSRNYERHAKRIVDDVLHLKRGENLTIEAWEHELDFANEVKFAARRRGAHAVLMVENEENYWRLFDEKAEKNLGVLGEHEWELVENSDAYVFFPGPGAAERSVKTDAKRRAAASAYNEEWYRRAAKAGIRGARVITAYATASRARLNGFDLEAWRQNVLDGIDVDYAKMQANGKKLAFLFKNGNRVSIKAPDGTDLSFELSGLEPHVYSGDLRKPLKYNKYSAMTQVPGGELDIVPKASTARGRVNFDRPVVQNGKRAEGLSWTFAAGRGGGKLAEYSAESGLELFEEGYRKARGDKDRIGALIIGLNPRLSYGFNYDYNVEGCVSLGIGALLEGDRNKTDYSFVASMSNATLSIDDIEVVRDGKLKVPI